MARSSSKTQAAVNVSKERLDVLTKLLISDSKDIINAGLREWLNNGVVLIAKMLLNSEVLELVGDRHSRNADRDCVRWGEQDGSVLLLEQRVPISKPRVRTKGGHTEVELQMYKQLNDKNFLNEQAAAKLLSGTSTRRFEKTLEKLLDGHGVGRQTVSQRAIAEMSLRFEEFRTRSLEDKEIVVVFIDGIHLGDSVYIAAVGIDRHGYRHVLDFEPGTIESSNICKGLLRNLLERKILSEEGSYLFVIDGSKALKKAIHEVFGNRSYIQRCFVHKKRNIKDKLPQFMQEEILQKFNAAYNKKTLKAAQAALVKLRQELIVKRRHAAANSLTEGMQELLTLHKLGITGALKKSLYTTNCIESVFSAAVLQSKCEKVA